MKMTRLNANNNGRVELRDGALERLAEFKRIGAERRSAGNLRPFRVSFDGDGRAMVMEGEPVELLAVDDRDEAQRARDAMKAAARARGLEV